MSFHVELEEAVHEQRTAYKKRVHTCENAMSVMLTALPNCFGGTNGHYFFTHPTEPLNEKRKSLDSQLMPEDKGTFATTLVIRAVVEVFCYMRFSHFKDGNVRVSLIGADDITCDIQKHGEGNAENLAAFGQKLYKTVVEKLTENPQLATRNVVRANDYPG